MIAHVGWRGKSFFDPSPNPVFANQYEWIAKRSDQDGPVDKILDDGGIVADLGRRHRAQFLAQLRMIAPHPAKAAHGCGRIVLRAAGVFGLALAPFVRIAGPAAIVGEDIDKVRIAPPEHLPAFERRVGGADGRRAGSDGAAEFVRVPGAGQL